MNTGIYTYGVTTFPNLGEVVAVDGGKTSSANTIASAFKGIQGNLKGLTIVPGHEFEIAQAWSLLVQAKALFESGYAGKPMN